MQTENARPEAGRGKQRPPAGQSAFQTARSTMPGTFLRERDEPKLLRALSIQHDIKRTAELVTTYNRTDDVDERNVLYKWLESFSTNKERCLRPGAILQYAQLAKIKTRSDRDTDLVKTMLSDLCSKIPNDRFAEKNVSLALYRALMWIDSSVADDVSTMVSLGEKLLASLCPTLELYAETFEEFEGTFLALPLIIHHIQKVAPYRLCWYEKKELRTAANKKRQVLKDSFTYYPARFHYDLLEQSIKRLNARQHVPFSVRMMECPILNCCSAVQTYNSFRSSSSAYTYRVVTLEDTIEEIREIAKAPRIREDQWYVLLQALTAAKLQTVKDETKMELFLKVLEALMESQQKMRGREGVKKLRFGTVHELCQLLTYGSEEVQKKAEEELLSLADKRASEENWFRDVDIFDAVIRAVHQVHIRGGMQSTETASLLRTLSKTPSTLHRKAFLTWLGSGCLEDKLNMLPESERRVADREELSAEIGEKIGYIPLEEVHRNIDDLKQKYKDMSFSMVSTLGDDRDRRNVGDMKHHIVVYKDTVRKNAYDHSTDLRSLYDPTSEHYTRVERATEPVDLENLFCSNPLQPDSASAVNRVLLYGDHGSGKTCIGKAIAYRWAMGEIMQDFKFVFMVSVKELDSLRQVGQKWNTLEEGIASLCYSSRYDSEMQTLLTLLEDAMRRTTTLLILDGVNEGEDSERSMVLDAKRRQCKILFLSRSYNIYNVRSDIDVEMECLGLDEKEAEKYIINELPVGEGERFIEYIRSDPVMWDLVRIPVTTYILCLLWKAGEPALADAKHRTMDFPIYTKTANFVWSRFSRNPGMENISRDEIFEQMESIAFESFRKGQILIGQILVKDHASTLVQSRVLMDCGLLLYKEDNAKYQFQHLRFQKYFAGRYAARHLHNTQTKEHRHIADFLSREKYKEKHRSTISFMAQALAQHHEVDELREIFSFMDRDPMEVIGVQHFFSKLRVIDSWIAGLLESSNEAWKNKTASQVVGAAARVLAQLHPTTHLWKVTINAFLKYPNIVHGFPAVLNAMIDGEKLEALIHSYRFEDAVKLAEYSPKHLESLKDIVRKRMEDEKESVRKQGLEMAKDLLAHHPSLLNEFLSLLERSCTHSDEDERQRTMLVIGTIMRKAPTLVDRLLAKLKIGCLDESAGVRAISMIALENCAAAAVPMSEDIISLFQHGCVDEAVDVRTMAMLAVGSALHRGPRSFNDFFPLLEKGCEDEHTRVRSKAIEAIGRLANVVHVIEPDPLDRIIPMVERACNDPDKDVRSSALEALGRFAAAFPQRLSDCESLIEKTHMGNDEDVRKNAEGVRDVVQNRATVRHCFPDDLFRMIEEGSTEGDDGLQTHVGNLTSERLETASVKATNTRARNDIQDLLEILIEVPIAIEHTGRPETVKFAPHRAGIRTTDALSREAVDFVVSTAEDCFEDKYPGVLYLMRTS